MVQLSCNAVGVYNSAEANEIEGFVPGPATEKEWESLYPLEKEALDLFH